MRTFILLLITGFMACTTLKKPQPAPDKSSGLAIFDTATLLTGSIDTGGVLTIIGDGSTLATAPIVKYDTVPVIMLICDTSIQKGAAWRLPNWSDTTGNARESGKVTTYDPYVTWRRGYVIRTGTPINTWTDANWAYNFTFRSDRYLDEDHKPIPGKIYVWMSVGLGETAHDFGIIGGGY